MIIPPADRLQHVKEYYFSRKLQEIRQMNASGKPVINLGIGNPDLPPSRATIDALISAAKQPQNHGYQSYRGIPALRNALSNWYATTYDVELNAESEILPLMGSKEGIMHISMAFLNAGDEVLVPNPGYPTYSSVTELVQAKHRYYDLDPTNNWKLDIDSLEQQDLSNVKLMWINYPHMPTGTDGDMELFKRLIALAKAQQFLIVNDNPYSMVLNEKPVSVLNCPSAKDVCLELNSLSKSHNMAGWRIGCLSGKQEYIDTVLKVKSNMDSGMFLPLQEAAAEALSNSESWHEERNAIYRERRGIVYRIFDLLGCTYTQDQCGMFVIAKLPDGAEDEAFVDHMLQGARVFITPGFIFGSNAKGYLRASLCNPSEVLEDALVRLDELTSEKS
jgi:LL-diaminopimelate aminotransferase